MFQFCLARTLASALFYDGLTAVHCVPVQIFGNQPVKIASLQSHNVLTFQFCRMSAMPMDYHSHTVYFQCCWPPASVGRVHVNSIVLCLFSVLLDTNQWYHGTEVIGAEMSITIGSEYDWAGQPTASESDRNAVCRTGMKNLRGVQCLSKEPWANITRYFSSST